MYESCAGLTDGTVIFQGGWTECPTAGHLCGASRARTQITCQDGDEITGLYEEPCPYQPTPGVDWVETGSVFVGSNEEFQALSGVDVITGDLVISGTSTTGGGDIETLSPLSELQCIGGTLHVVSQTALESLGGLEQLVYLRNLVVTGNGELSNLQGLNNLSYVAGSIMLHGSSYWVDLEEEGSSNEQLRDLTGLENLSLVGDSFEIIGSEGLITVSGLENLETVMGSFTLDSCALLEHVGGLSALTYVGGAFTLKDNLALTSLNGLENLTGVGAGLTLEGNAVDGIGGLAGLEFIGGGSLTISDTTSMANLQQIRDVALAEGVGLVMERNSGLRSLDGLVPSSRMERLVLTGNPDLTQISALSEVEIIELSVQDVEGVSGDAFKHLSQPEPANLHLVDNPDLSDIGGLSSLQYVGGDLVIQGNTGLDSLHSLSALTHVWGTLSISGSGSLTDLSGLSSLVSVSGLELFNLDSLESFSGLESLVSIGASDVEGNTYELAWLYVAQNDNLLSFDGLNSLDEIGLILHVENNPALENIDALSGVSQLDAIRISSNVSLESIQGLDNLEEVNSVTICLNSQLPQCEVDAFVERAHTGTVLMVNCGNDTTATCE